MEGKIAIGSSQNFTEHYGKLIHWRLYPLFDIYYKWTEIVDNIQVTHFGEVQFFFRAEIEGQMHGLALISKYGPPDAELLHQSSNALWVSQYQGNEQLKVINIKSIATCIAMIPFMDPPDGRFFVCEKMGLEIGYLGGVDEDLNGANDPDV